MNEIIQRKNIPIYIFLCFSIIIFLATYPSQFSIVDEGYYISMSFGIAEGDMQVTRYSLLQGKSIETFRGEYAPLTPLLLSPFSALAGNRAVFLSFFLLLIISFFVFIKILDHYEISRWFGLYYLLHPILFFFSRTVMSDAFSAYFIVFFLYFYLKKGRAYIWAGIFFGLSLSIRQTNLLIGIPFLLSLLVKNRKGILYFLIGLVPIIAVIPLYQYLIWGDPFFMRHAMAFSFSNIPKNFLFYFIWLNVIYPLSLISIAFFRKEHYRSFISVVILFLILYSLYEYTAQMSRFPLNVFLSYRFFLPIIPLILIAYADLLERWFKPLFKKFFTPIFAGVIPALLLAVVLVLSIVHRRETDQLEHIRDLVADRIEENSYLMFGMNADKLHFEFLFPESTLISEYPMPFVDTEGRETRRTLTLPENERPFYFIAINRPDRSRFNSYNEVVKNYLIKTYSAEELINRPIDSEELSVLKVR